jgi:hypothetical protein
VEWRKQLEDAALLGLGVRELFLETLRRLALSLKKLYAE